MPIVNEANLSVDGTSWSGSFVDGASAALPAYVRQTWVAEVRYAPERDLEAGAVEADGAIRPGGEAVRGAYPSAWSDASLPCNSVVVPPAGPAQPLGATAAANPDGTVTIAIPAVPLHKLALGTNEGIVYRETVVPPSLDVVARKPLQTNVAIIDPTPGTKYHIVICDPAGRFSAETVVSVAPPP
jgi:hypothetical protein